MSKVQERLLKLMNSHLKTNIASLDMNSHFATTTDYAADNDEVIQVIIMFIYVCAIVNNLVLRYDRCILIYY